MPLLRPNWSKALPSPRHQLTRPEGDGVQFVRSAETVRAIVAEIITPSRILGVRTRLCDVISSFILNLPHDGLHAIVLLFIHRSEEHTSELQSLRHLVCRLLLDKT